MFTLPLELIASSMCITYWQSNINPVAWVAIFYVGILVVNIFGVRGYGEVEFVLSIIKILAVVGFIILGICINTGGIVGGGQGYIGGKYWHDPGPFNNGFKGVCSVFVTSAFAFAGTEMAGLAAAETKNPRKTLPTACKQVFWRILLFYVVSLTIVGLLVPYNDPKLLGTNSVDITASPFVIAIKNSGIKVLPSIINVVVMLAVLSVGNSSVYGASRTLVALAEQGAAPKILGYIDRRGRPLVANGLTFLCGLLCFMSGSDKQVEVFNWLMALAGLEVICTWLSVNVAHIRFRRAWKVQGRDPELIPFRAQTGVIGSAVAIAFAIFIFVAQFWTALFPIGGKPDPSYFFQKYLAACAEVVFCIVHLVWKRPKWTKCEDIDLDTGRREVDLDLLKQEISEEKEILAGKPWWNRVYHFWC